MRSEFLDIINLKNKDGKMPLFYIMSHEDLDMLTSIFDLGIEVDVDYKFWLGNRKLIDGVWVDLLFTPLEMLASKLKRHEELFKKYGSAKHEENVKRVKLMIALLKKNGAR